MRVLQTLQFDVRFQIRHGFYYAYAFVSLLYVGLLRALPVEFREMTSTLLITSDPAVLGLFFVGGIVLLERGQNILESLFVTPLRVREYLIAKVASLTLLSLVTSFFIAFLTFGVDFQQGYLFLGIVLTSVLFTLFGISVAVRAKSLNGFLAYSSWIAVFFLPFLEFFGIVKTPLFYLFPTKGSLLLIGGAFQGMTLPELVYSVVVLLGWIVVGYRWAYHWFYQYIIMKIGGGR